MPDLLRFETPNFEMSIWCKKVKHRQDAFQSMLQKRPRSDDGYQRPCITFSPSLNIELVAFDAEKEPESVGKVLSELEFPSPVFFENVQYQFEWSFFSSSAPVTDAYIEHPIQSVVEGFRFIKPGKNSAGRLTGTINTANNVGALTLTLVYVSGGQRTQVQFNLEVLPSKMDLHHDLPVMYRDIDKVLPLWRFKWVQKTEQQASQSSVKGEFPLLWLANFKSLRKQFEQGLKVILQAPHSRLQTQVSHVKAERLKGRVANRLAEKVRLDAGRGIQNKRYRYEKQQLSFDTVENRFIKMVVLSCKKQLMSIEANFQRLDSAQSRRWSDAFVTELHNWQLPMNKVLAHGFLKGVGSFSGLNRESLVLQQKTGYSRVYRVWQQLKFYLDLFANQAQVSMRSVDKIYEVWCFLEVKRLLESIDFELQSEVKPTLQLNELHEYQLKKGFKGTFKFKRADGIEAELNYEPSFGRESEDIRTYWTEQKPDIVLRVTLPNADNKQFIWLFDAKYRVELNDKDTTDYVPNDAINQLHRYRDALIRLSGASDLGQDKSRPVIGAFALYPGFFDQQGEKNPYQQAIDEVGIGAFALLPSDIAYRGSHWLLHFLSKHIGLIAADIFEERLLLQEAARIPHYGMKQVLYPDLTLVCAMDLIDEGAASGFHDSDVHWYYLPQADFIRRFNLHVFKELKFIALIVDVENQGLQINQIWRIKQAKLVKRREISLEQGAKPLDSDEAYYLFELSKPLSLRHSITDVPVENYRIMRLTTLSYLDSAQQFKKLQEVYSKVYSQD